jgi:hypothetical protein
MSTPEGEKTANLVSETHQTIPEAKALKWDELLPPTQKAMKELLAWLNSACQSSSMDLKEKPEEKLVHEHEQVATSLLINGNRGSGKTTVLLTAAYALQLASKREREPYFTGTDQKPYNDTLEQVSRQVYWLETLDLEPLPGTANLLATLLVRIQKALEPDESDEPSVRAHYSFLENRREISGDLSALVDDATFMWEENLAQQDPRRERAEQQVRAADLYAKFPKQFRDVMDKVCNALQISGRSDRVLVLPIDNVDRSIDHIANISKLIRMATSRRLWFVLAAGRPEFQLYLERSFQRELLSGRNVISTAETWDQTQSIARRQAATSMRRSLPTHYQIEIESMKAEEAWIFPRGKGSETASTGGDNCISQLFSEITLPKNARFHKPTKVPEDNRGLADFFDVKSHIDKDVLDEYIRAQKAEAGSDDVPIKEIDSIAKNEPVLSRAARMSLSLSARSLKDLQTALVRAKTEQEPKKSGEAAVSVAVQMLSNAIDESNLPFWASERLLNRILRRDSNARYVLDLTGSPIEPFRQKQAERFSPIERPPVQLGEYTLEEALTCYLVRDINLQICDHDTKRRVPLPPDVAGWFMVLHDLLMLFSEPRVLSKKSLPAATFSPAVSARHTLLPLPSGRQHETVEFELRWEPPKWETFHQHFLFSSQWKAFHHKIARAFGRIREFNAQALRDKYRESVEKTALLQTRIVLLAWVEAVSSVAPVDPSSDDSIRRWQWKREDGLWHVLEEIDSSGDIQELQMRAAVALRKYARRVCETLGRLVDQYQKRIKADGAVAEAVDARVSWPDWKWMKETLPLLAFPEYLMAPKATDGDISLNLFSWSRINGEESQPDGWTTLVSAWERDQDHFRERRHEAISRALKKSYRRRHRAPEETRELYDFIKARDGWADRNTRRWLRLIALEGHPSKASHPLAGLQYESVSVSPDEESMAEATQPPVHH